MAFVQPAPAVFAWDMDPEYVDVPFPDFSYWGHEVDRFRGPGGESGLCLEPHSSHAVCTRACRLFHRDSCKGFDCLHPSITRPRHLLA